MKDLALVIIFHPLKSRSVKCNLDFVPKNVHVHEIRSKKTNFSRKNTIRQQIRKISFLGRNSSGIQILWKNPISKMGFSFFHFELETPWFEERDFSATFREKSVSRFRLRVACSRRGLFFGMILGGPNLKKHINYCRFFIFWNSSPESPESAESAESPESAESVETVHELQFGTLPNTRRGSGWREF